MNVPAPTGHDYYWAEVAHDEMAHRFQRDGDTVRAELHFARADGCCRAWTYDDATGALACTR
jgi:hypothetical protein